ncbi:NAD(P)/FAD-dependent oxidoreductase [Nocardia sp. BMG51109]|uniref:protoporphyrinogen/coproporphyrinogen oxidase n=1 Tax=Nocardia sp. BMG51109 TaxID=1056816 RepID=UPI0012EC8EFC|nr:NAD(P)/FAD-dependent oxidoreductase [Nocardia sp. BMG51109]
MVISRSRGRVIVVGAGVAGLTAAYRLHCAGYSVTTLERENHVGGRMVTAEREGYRYDVAASLLPNSYRNMRRLIADAGLRDRVVACPDRIGLHGTTGYCDVRAADLLSVFDRRVAVGGLDDEDLASYCGRIYGPRTFDRIIEPLAVAAFFGPPERLSAAYSPFLEYTGAPGFFASPEGVAFLPEGLAGRLDVELSAEVRHIEQGTDRVDVEWQRSGRDTVSDSADAVVLAVPARHVADVFSQLTPGQEELLGSVTSSAHLVVHVALTERPRSEAMWMLLPRNDSPDLVSIVLEHNKSPGRVPPGTGMLNLHWRQQWSEKHIGSSDAAVAETAMAAVSKIFPGVEDTVRFIDIRRWEPCCIPLRRPGHFTAFAKEFGVRSPASRVFLAGDYLGVPSTDTAVAMGERAAAEVMRELGPPE